jgi:long-chain fatty acid transport protein
MMRKRLQSAAALALLACAATSGADEFHYNNILVGDRASGMGGAYTAISDDPGGMYYNPAGIAYSTGKNLSASVNAYSVSNRTYKNVIGGQDWTRTSSTLLPNFFGVIQPVGRFKFGFSYAVPDSNQEDQDQSFKRSSYLIKDAAGTVLKNWGSATHVINFNNKNDTNLFGPSAAFQVTDSFSVGTTLYVHKRNTHAILNNTIQSDDQVNHLWSNSYLETDEWGIKPIVGFMWAPVDKVSVGVAVSRTVILKSDVMSQNTVTTNDTTITASNILFRSNEPLDITNDKRKYPYQVTAGLAFFPDSSLLLSGDISYSTAYEYEFIGSNNKRDAVINGALGAEYYINKNWAVRGGAFTDFANTPSLVEGEKNQKEHIDMFGGSLTVSHFTKNTSISGGGSYKYGKGKSQIEGGSGAIQDANSNNWTMFISSSYSY